MDVKTKSLEWKYACAMLLLVEDGVQPNLQVVGESTENEQKLTEKQLEKKMKSLPEVELGEQSIFWSGQEAYPEQEIFIRILNLKAWMLEEGIETYMTNFLPPRDQFLHEKLEDLDSKDCLNFVVHHHQFLNVPSVNYFGGLFGKKFGRKHKKALKNKLTPQFSSHFTDGDIEKIVPKKEPKKR